MRFLIAVPALAASLLAIEPLATPAAAGCSSDAFAIRGVALTVDLCVTGGASRASARAPIAVSETLAVRGQPTLARRISLDAVPGDETARTIDDAPLQGLGIAGTLHMTLAYRNGAVRLEHALLVPGAIALK
ncbi:MAG: hypothetical protein NVS2B3_12090 [Vulcanimicrobiaceae bacterium]